MEDTLEHIAPGQTVVVHSMLPECNEQLAARLEALGFTPGQTVTVVRSAPLRDPVVYRVCDQVLCLRKREAAMIKVSVNTPAAVGR